MALLAQALHQSEEMVLTLHLRQSERPQ